MTTSNVKRARRRLGLRCAVALAAATLSAAGLLGHAARADASPCPSTWGFDATGTVGLDSREALPGQFDGATNCTGTFMRNAVVLTDETTGAVVGRSPGFCETIAESPSPWWYGPCNYDQVAASTWLPVVYDTQPTTHGIHVLDDGTQTGSPFVPTKGHVYRGDYWVRIYANAGQAWLSWPPACSVDSTQTVLTCDYSSTYSSSLGPAPAPAQAVAMTSG